MLKTNNEWLKKNMGPDLKIWTQMFKEIDWGEVKRKTKLSLQRDKERIVGEFKGFMAMTPKEKMDIIMNGDIHLGWLYKKDAIAFARREWKGLKSVGIDFTGWLVLSCRLDATAVLGCQAPLFFDTSLKNIMPCLAALAGRSVCGASSPTRSRIPC